MLISQITNHGNIPILEKVMAFSEARQGVLAENMANIETPGYKAQYLDPIEFQHTLRDAVERRGGHRSAPLEMRATEQVRYDDSGRLVAHPATRPPQNILFHDRTNARIERLMTDVADNVMAYNMASQFLNAKYDALKTAIRGEV